MNLRILAQSLKRLEASDTPRKRVNARRAMFGALRSLRHQINKEYPALVVARPHEDHALKAAKTANWRHVEYTFVNPGRAPWNREEAEAFNVWFASKEGMTPKPIRFDIPDRARLLGQHTKDAIRIKGIDTRLKWRSAELWRTFLHELAHYKVNGHGPEFRAEIIRVYRLWKQFRKRDESL